MTRHQTMGRYQFMFYATARDLAPVLSLLEGQKKLQYTPTHHVVTDRAQIYLSYADIPDFGQTNNSTPVPAAEIIWFDELEHIALHFFETGERCGIVFWKDLANASR